MKFMERFKVAKANRGNWAERYRDAQDYFCPARQTFDSTVPGESKRNDPYIFDSTGEDSLANFVSNLQSSLCPPMKRWTTLEGGPNLPDNNKSNMVMHDVEEKLYNGIKNSNFDTQISASFQDLAMGTAALLAFKHKVGTPFRFCAVPLSQLYIEEGVDGRIDTAFREFNLQYNLIERHWSDAKIPADVIKECMDKKDKKLKLIEGSYPSEITLLRDGRQIAMEGHVYEVYIDGIDEPIVHREEATPPWIIFRWSNVPGEVYGRGPALTALADVKSLNETKRILLENGSIMGSGMYTVLEDDLVNLANVRLVGGAMIPVSSNEGGVNGRSIAPLAPAGSPDMSQMIIKDLQESINKVMFGSPLGDVNLPVKTATEMSLRQQDLAKRIGSAFGKLQYEFLSPLVKRLIDILYELGEIEVDSTYINGNEINIVYKSPLAQAQDEEDIQRLLRFMELVVNTVGPQGSGMVLKMPQALREIAELMSLNPEFVVSEAEAKDIMQKLMQMQQQQQAQGQNNDQMAGQGTQPPQGG